MHQPNQPNYIWSTFVDCEALRHVARFQVEEVEVEDITDREYGDEDDDEDEDEEMLDILPRPLLSRRVSSPFPSTLSSSTIYTIN
jgi:hypothetical protein